MSRWEEKIIVALDFANEKQALALIAKIPNLKFVKVGMELFYSCGPDLIKKLKAKNLKIFLDLKIHDIPNTAARTAKALAHLKVDIINVHAAGGKTMLKAANTAYKEVHSEGKLIAVTQLTSTSQEEMNSELLIPGNIETVVTKYAQLSYQARLDGVVCSPLEVKAIKQATHEDFLCITPGVRLACSADDQHRIKTPREAIQNGADYIVVGREITQSKDPARSFNTILEDIK